MINGMWDASESQKTLFGARYEPFFSTYSRKSHITIKDNSQKSEIMQTRSSTEPRTKVAILIQNQKQTKMPKNLSMRREAVYVYLSIQSESFHLVMKKDCG